MIFEKNFFVRQKFSEKELDNYRCSAKRDLDIAKSNTASIVKLHFAYMALIKIGIHQIAKEGYRVKGKQGHHIKIIDSLSRLLKSEDINIIGDKMRKNRNLDLYTADIVISTDEINEYIQFVDTVYKKI